MTEDEVAHQEWKKIQAVIVGTFRLCECQRKLKSIIDALYSIYVNLDAGMPYTFTGAEWLLLGMMDKSSDMVTHGINAEYPILNRDDVFWQWILEIKDSPYLRDN